MRITAVDLIARLENDNLNQKENKESAELRSELELEEGELQITDLDDEQFVEILTRLQSSGLSNAVIRLDLSKNQLTALPPAIGQLTALREFFVKYNQLSAVPPEIGKLTALNTLDLTNNQLTAVPPEIGQLTALNTLDLSSNQLTTLPPEIKKLTALQGLWLHNNRLATLPSEIRRLTALIYLGLNYNKLTALPSEIGQLTALQYLSLIDNQLTVLLPEIGQLTALQQLWLDDNQLIALPSEIWRLTALQHLNLINNQLTVLSPEIGQLTALRELWLSDNRLTALPSTLGNITALSSTMGSNVLDDLAQETPYFDIANNPLEADKPSTIDELKAVWRSFQAAYRRTFLRTLEIKAAFKGSMLKRKKADGPEERLQLAPDLAEYIAAFAVGPDLQGLPPVESQILEESVNPDAKPRNKLKPLYEAITDNNVKKLSEILSDKDTPVHLDVQFKVGYKMRTLLHAAASKDVSSELTRLLLDEGANPNQVDSDGLTPVERAVLQGRTDILAVYQLFRCKIQDSTWEKAARQYPVIAKKCDPNIDYKELKNILDTVQKERIQKELSEARRAGNRGEVAKILKSNTNLDLNASGEGALLLFDATERNAPDIVSFLLEAGVDPNVTIVTIVDDRAQLITAVHLATIKGLKEVLQAYSDSGKVTLETWKSVEKMLKHMFEFNQTSARHDEYKEVREVIRVAKEKTLAKSGVTQTLAPAALTFDPRATTQGPFVQFVPPEPKAGVIASAKAQPK